MFITLCVYDVGGGDGGHARAIVHMRKDNFINQISPSTVSSRYQTQVLRLMGQMLLPAEPSCQHFQDNFGISLGVKIF